MTEAMEEEQSSDLSEREELVLHHYVRLLELDFPPDDALHLVGIPGFDWHDAERLLKKGCPHKFVIQLLEE